MTYMTRPYPLGGFSDVLSAAKNVVEDPCLFETANLVNRLHELTSKPTKPGSPPPPPQRGIGLCSAVTPLRYVVKVYERPWLPIAGAAVFLGLVFAAGFATGRSR